MYVRGTRCFREERSLLCWTVSKQRGTSSGIQHWLKHSPRPVQCDKILNNAGKNLCSKSTRNPAHPLTFSLPETARSTLSVWGFLTDNQQPCWTCCAINFDFFEAGSLYMVLTVLKLTMQARLSGNLWGSACLSLWSAGIKDVHLHA